MRRLIIFVLILLYPSIHLHADNPNPTGCRILSVECVQRQFGSLDEYQDYYSVSDYGLWAPEKGVILHYGQQGVFQVFLKFDENAKLFYEQNPWAGLEIDIISRSLFPKILAGSVQGPSGANTLRDTIVSDPRENVTRGVTITRPSKLTIGWNEFSFKLVNPVVGTIGFTANIQLVANVGNQEFSDNIYQKNSNWWAYEWLVKWYTVANLGYNFSLFGEVFKYFTMANAGQQITEISSTEDKYTYIDSSTVGEGICWNSHTDPAEKCNTSNLSQFVGKPDENARQDSTEEVVTSVSQEVFVDVVEAVTGLDYSGINGSANPLPGTNSGGTGDTNLSITRFELKDENGGYRHEVNRNLYPGGYFHITGELVLRNKSGNSADNIDIDYRVDHGRNFDTNDTKLDEDEETEIGGYSSITKHMARLKVSLSNDGRRLNFHRKNGSIAESFAVNNGQAKAYIFVDAENVDTGDDDISNDYSKDNEYGVVKVNVFFPPSSPDFTWSSAGTVAGKHCAHIYEAADPHTWDDNYFCSSKDYGMQWYSGGVAGVNMRCTHIHEAADPATWHDNYLCVPHSSSVTFSWSSAGPISGKLCTRWYEAAEPVGHTWHDNYLCHEVTRPRLPPVVGPQNPETPSDDDGDEEQPEGIDASTLSISNVVTDSPYETGTATCLPYSYIAHSGQTANVTELAQVFKSDWSEMLVDMNRHIPLDGNTSGEGCANIAMPDVSGDYVANICLSLWDGSADTTKCANASFSVIAHAEPEDPRSPGGTVELSWFDLFDQNWSSATTFSVNQQIPVIFGIRNGTTATQWVYSEMKIFTGSWGALNTESQTVEMAAGANKPASGHDPRFSVSFSQPGEYIVQICAAEGCLDSKRITVQ